MVLIIYKNVTEFMVTIKEKNVKKIDMFRLYKNC